MNMHDVVGKDCLVLETCRATGVFEKSAMNFSTRYIGAEMKICKRARDFYEVIVDEGEARINSHLTEIESE